MNRSACTLVFYLSITLAIIASTGCSKKEENLKDPSEISSQVWDSIMPMLSRGEISDRKDFYGAIRKFTRELIDSMRTEGLSKEEMIECADIYGDAGYVDKAVDILTPLIKEDSSYAKEAMKSLIMVKIKNGAVDEAEKLMDDFRKRFPPNRKDTRYLFSEVMELTDLLNRMNKSDDAVRVIMEDLNALKFDAPYASFYNVNELLSLAAEKGSIDWVVKMADSLSLGLSKSYKAYKDTVTYSDSSKASDDETAKSYESMIRTFDDLRRKAALIGKRAPTIKFAHVYNADSNATFDDLRGKVTILDFWATWCVPCIIGFRELGDLYKEYGPKGLRIISITSFQGKFKDEEAGIDEGTDENKISREREIELTGRFIKKHGLKWPVAFSEGSVFDDRYAVRGIPTYVVIDKKGAVRCLYTGIGRRNQLKRLLKKLLNEA